jgi:hypothetical protein
LHLTFDCIERAENILRSASQQRARRQLVNMSRPNGRETPRAQLPRRVAAQLRAIPDATLETLAAAYELDPTVVARDAQGLACWSVPLDEFLALLCRRHKWSLETATIYLSALRSAQQSNDVGCPWLDEAE